MCMVVGELTEVSAIVATQVPQWFETDTKKYVDVTSPDNIMVQGRLENGAIVNAYCGVHPYHGSGHRFEIYGRDGTLSMIGGGEGGEERRRKLMGGHKDDKALQELPVPERFTWVPEAVRNDGPAYDVGQMWVKFAEAIRTGSNAIPTCPTSITRCAATERWMPSCALHRRGNGRKLPNGGSKVQGSKVQSRNRWPRF